MVASYLHSTVPAARIRNNQKCSSFDAEMHLIWDGPGRSVLGLGRSGTVRSASGMVRERSGVIRVDTVLGPVWSGTVRSAAVVVRGIRVGSVFIRSAAVLCPG